MAITCLSTAHAANQPVFRKPDKDGDLTLDQLQCLAAKNTSSTGPEWWAKITSRQ